MTAPLTPPLLDATWYIGAYSLMDKQWDLSTERIRIIQDAVLQFKNLAFDLEDIANSLYNPGLVAGSENLMDCARAFCAAAMCLPHPRLSEIIDYVGIIGSEDTFEISNAMSLLFDYNPMRKYRVIESLDEAGLKNLKDFLSIYTKDVALALIVNDEKHVHKFTDYDYKRTQNALTQIKYFPERAVGWLEPDPQYFAHAEVIGALSKQGTAIVNRLSDLSDQDPLYDRDKWLELGPVSLDEPWHMRSLIIDKRDHGIFDRPETLRTIKAHPGESIAAFAEALRSGDAHEFDRDLIAKAVDTFIESGLSPNSLFNQLCQGMSLMDHNDRVETNRLDPESFMRNAVIFSGAAASPALGYVAACIVAKEPFELIHKACFTDHQKKLLCHIFPERKLDIMRTMEDSGKDRVFSSDLGL